MLIIYLGNKGLACWPYSDLQTTWRLGVPTACTAENPSITFSQNTLFETYLELKGRDYQLYIYVRIPNVWLKK